MAYTFGNTSPNSKIKKVTKTTSTKNFTPSESSLKNTSPREANINTIKILIKLLVIKMVANSFFGFSRSSTTLFFCFDVVESSLNWVGEIEKKATSAPETNAEDINKDNNTKQFIIVNKSMFDIAKNKELGSVSNF